MKRLTIYSYNLQPIEASAGPFSEIGGERTGAAAHWFAEDLLPICNLVHSVENSKKYILLFVKSRPLRDECGWKFKTLFLED